MATPNTYCPFCGDEGELDEVGAGSHPVFIVVCNGCAAFGPPGETPEAAAANWDMRQHIEEPETTT